MNEAPDSFLGQLRDIKVKPNSRRAIRNKLVTVVSESADTHPITMRAGEYYKVEIRVGAECFVQEPGLGSRHEYAIKQIQHSIARTIYNDVHAALDEVLPMLLELRTPANYDDIEPIIERLNRLYDQVRP